MTPELESYIARREAALADVRALLVERLHVDREPDTIDPDTPLFGTGLGLDSVDAVEMVVSIEDAFGLKLPDDAIGRRVMRTVGKLVDMILAYQDALASAEAAGADANAAASASADSGAAASPETAEAPHAS